MLRLVGAAVVAVLLLLLVGDAVGLDVQRAWVVDGLQETVGRLDP